MTSPETRVSAPNRRSPFDHGGNSAGIALGSVTPFGFSVLVRRVVECGDAEESQAQCREKYEGRRNHLREPNQNDRPEEEDHGEQDAEARDDSRQQRGGSFGLAGPLFSHDSSPLFPRFGPSKGRSSRARSARTPLSPVAARRTDRTGRGVRPIAPGAAHCPGAQLLLYRAARTRARSGQGR